MGFAEPMQTADFTLAPKRGKQQQRYPLLHSTPAVLFQSLLLTSGPSRSHCASMAELQLKSSMASMDMTIPTTNRSPAKAKKNTKSRSKSIGPGGTDAWIEETDVANRRKVLNTLWFSNLPCSQMLNSSHRSLLLSHNPFSHRKRTSKNDVKRGASRLQIVVFLLLLKPPYTLGTSSSTCATQLRQARRPRLLGALPTWQAPEALGHRGKDHCRTTMAHLIPSHQVRRLTRQRTCRQ